MMHIELRIDKRPSVPQIGETLADKLEGVALPTIKVEEPTVKMSFSVNTSPFAGREVHFSSL